MQPLLAALIDPQHTVQPVTDEAGQPRWLGHIGQGSAEVQPMDQEAAELFEALIKAGCLEADNEVPTYGQLGRFQCYRLSVDHPEAFAAVIDAAMRQTTAQDAVGWYRDASLPGFDNQTPAQLVTQGLVEAVLNHLKATEVGGYA